MLTECENPPQQDKQHVKGRREFPPAVRTELKPFREHWETKRKDYLEFYDYWQEFINCCRSEQIDEFPNELMFDWMASWAQNVFFGFFLPTHRSVPQELFHSAVLDLEAFLHAYSYVCPRLSYPDAHRFWADIPELPNSSERQYPFIVCNDLTNDLDPLRPSEVVRALYGQSQLIKYASVFLNNPTQSDWGHLRSMKWGTDPAQPVWDPESVFNRCGEMIRESLPILSKNFRIKLDPSARYPLTTFDVLIQHAENLCNDIDLDQQSLTAPRESEGVKPSAVAAETPTAKRDAPAVNSEQSPSPAMADETPTAERVAPDEQPLMRIMRLYTNRVSDERIRNIAVIVASKMTVNEKLTKIDALLPIPTNASAEELGKMFGVTGQAVFKTGWWTLNRKGERDSEIGRRKTKHKRRAEDYEPPTDETG